MSTEIATVPSARMPESDRAARNETVIAGQNKALELAIRGAPLREVLDVIVATVESQSSSGVLGSILLLDEDGRTMHHGAAPSLPAAYSAAIDGIVIGAGVGSCGTAAFTGETVVVRDIATHPHWAKFKALAMEHGLRACWSTPIRSSQGKVLGTFALYHRHVAEPSARDQEIVELLGRTATLVIERELHARQHAADEAALHAARDQRIARMATLFEYAPAAVAVLRGREHVFDLANPNYVALVGGREVVGKSVREALPELEGQGFYELLDQVRDTGRAYVGRAQRVGLRDARGADYERYVDFVYQPVPDPRHNVESILVVAFDVTDLVRAKLVADEARARAEAIATEVVEQSKEAQHMLLELRAAKERAEERLRQLETRGQA